MSACTPYVTGTDDGVAQLAGRADKVVGKLLHLLGKPAAESKPAATALVNLMARPEVITVAVTKARRCKLLGG